MEVFCRHCSGKFVPSDLPASADELNSLNGADHSKKSIPVNVQRTCSEVVGVKSAVSIILPATSRGELLYTPKERIPLLKMSDRKMVGNSLRPFTGVLNREGFRSSFIALGWYIPGKACVWSRYSASIRFAKDGKERYIDLFARYLDQVIKPGAVLVAVPPHQEGSFCAMRRISKMLAFQGRIDVTSCLMRKNVVVQASHGKTKRNVEKHVTSIMVQSPGRICRQHLLLLDDVVTTGSSMLACKYLLLQAGAASVTCLALGRTRFSG
jgi:hypothetical protein